MTFHQTPTEFAIYPNDYTAYSARCAPWLLRPSSQSTVPPLGNAIVTESTTSLKTQAPQELR